MAYGRIIYSVCVFEMENWRERARMCEFTAGSNIFFIFIYTFSHFQLSFRTSFVPPCVTQDRKLPWTAVSLKATVINPKQAALSSSAAVTWRPRQSELSGQLARTCKIKRRNILTFRGLFTPLPSEGGDKAPSCPLISRIFVSIQRQLFSSHQIYQTHRNAKMALTHEHGTLQDCFNIGGIPPHSSMWPRFFWLNLHFKHA